MKRIFHILLLLGLVLTTWAQGTSALEHQFIARQMYNNFPEVFKNGGDVSDLFSYYRWQDFKKFYTDRCNSVEKR